MAGKETSVLYDRDFVEWTRHNARLLRDGRISEVDIEHVAEEIEDMGKRDRRSLESQVRRLLVHLLKHQFQPARRSRSWTSSIVQARVKIFRLIKDSPSLRAVLESTVAEVYPEAVRIAAAETGFDRKCFPGACRYTLDQLMDMDFLPVDEPGQ